MNMIQLAGRLGADAESRTTPNGQKVTSFRMATNSRRQGKDETTWWRITLWGDRWDRMLPYLTKGSAVLVWGEMRPPELYTDRNGQQQVSLDVWADAVKFSPFGKPQDENAQPQQQQNQGGGYPQQGQPQQQNQNQSGGYQQQAQQQPWEMAPSSNSNEDEDEIPF